MSDPTVSDLARILSDDTTMGTRLEVAWLENGFERCPACKGGAYRAFCGACSGVGIIDVLHDERRFVGAVRYDPERNVIELVCCPPGDEP